MSRSTRDLLAEARAVLAEKADVTLPLPGKPGKWIYKKKIGVWRTTSRGNRVFWPDDAQEGDAPMGQAGLGKGGPADKPPTQGTEPEAQHTELRKKPGLLRRVWNKLKSALGMQKAEAVMLHIQGNQALLEVVDRADFGTRWEKLEALDPNGANHRAIIAWIEGGADLTEGKELNIRAIRERLRAIEPEVRVSRSQSKKGIAEAKRPRVRLSDGTHQGGSHLTEGVPKSLLKKSVEAMRLYLGGVDFAPLKAQERFHATTLKLVQKVADATGLQSSAAWKQIETEARRQGVIKPKTGQHY